MSDRNASARRSGKKRHGHRKRRGASNNQAQAIPNAKATTRTTSSSIDGANGSRNGHAAESAVGRLRNPQIKLAQDLAALPPIPPHAADGGGVNGKVQHAESSEDVWDTGWDTGLSLTAPPDAPAGKDVSASRAHGVGVTVLGALAQLGRAHASGERAGRVLALARRRPAAAAVLALLLLGFVLTCFAPLIPLLRLGYDAVDLSHRVSALQALVAGDPAELANAGTRQEAQLQIAAMRQDLYEINGAMSVIATPLGTANSNVRNYQLLARIGLDLTTAAQSGMEFAQTLMLPTQGSAVTAGITSADVQQAQGALALARTNVLDAYQAYLSLDQRTLPDQFKPPATIGKLLATLPTILSATDTMQTLLDAAPALLGIGQPAYYLIAAMDSTELRPGGGFIGNYGILGLQDGQEIKSLPLALNDTYALDQKYYQNALEPYRLQQGVKTVTAVKGCQSLGPQPPALYWWWPFRAFDPTCKYGWGLRDANLSASFPENAQTMMRIVESVDGVVPSDAPLQGVIAFTPEFIKDILTITGPILVPQFNVTVNATNLEDMIHKYQLTDARPQQGDRKAFTHQLSMAMLDRLKSLHGDGLKALIKAGQIALMSKDLQVYFADPRAESVLQQLGVASEISTRGDGFMVVDANDGGNKANAYVTERQTDVVTLLPDGGAIHHLQITVTYDKGRHSVFPGTTRQDDYSDFQRTYLPGDATILGMAGYNPNTFTPVGCRGSGVPGYGSLISDCSPKYAIINPVTTSDVPGRTMVGGALLLLCGRYNTFPGTGLEYQSCETEPRAHSQTIYITWYTPRAFAVRADGHGSYTEVVEHQAGNPQSLAVYVDASLLRAGGSGVSGITPDATIQGKTPAARAAAFAALLGNATLVFEGPLSQNQTVTYHF
jgi:Protein of unknown function (DUF4012)